MSFLLGYIVGTTMNKEIPEVNIQVKKCENLPTKAETYSCLQQYEKECHDANIFAVKVGIGVALGIALIIVLIKYRLYKLRQSW